MWVVIEQMSSFKVFPFTLQKCQNLMLKPWLINHNFKRNNDIGNVKVLFSVEIIDLGKDVNQVP